MAQETVVLTRMYILIAAPFSPRSADPSMATRVTILSFCVPIAVACDTEYVVVGVESGGLSESDWRL